MKYEIIFTRIITREKERIVWVSNILSLAKNILFGKVCITELYR